MYNGLIDQKPDNLKISVDLPNLNCIGSPYPPTPTHTHTPAPTGYFNDYSDIVILNRTEKKIFVLELTCILEQKADTRNVYKTSKYIPLKSDLESQGLSESLGPFDGGTSLKKKKNETHKCICKEWVERIELELKYFFL